MLDAIIISDLHLGSSICKANLLLKYLSSFTTKTSRRLVLNGDIFESHDFRRLKKSHWKILNLLRKLSKNMEVVWVVGNHCGPQQLLSQLLGVTVVDEYSFVTGNKKVLVLHGHQFDDFLEDHPTITWVADILYTLLQKIDTSHILARWIKMCSKTYLRCLDKIRQGAIQKAAEGGFLIVFCGHSHHMEYYLDEDTGIEYYNSGSWTELPAGVIEVKDETITLIRKYDVDDTRINIPSSAAQAMDG